MYKRIMKWLITRKIERELKKVFKKDPETLKQMKTQREATAAIIEVIAEHMYDAQTVFVQIERASSKTPRQQEPETVDQLLARLGMKTKKEN